MILTFGYAVVAFHTHHNVVVAVVAALIHFAYRSIALDGNDLVVRIDVTFVAVVMTAIFNCILL